jgi:dimethylhistidine N-methyltransferase
MLGLYRLNVSIRRRLKMSHRQFVTDANRKAFASANHRINSTVSDHTAFRADVLEGLSNSQKRIPCRWLYDRKGSELFEAITRLAEYYPSRTETAILKSNGQAMANFVGPEAILFEYGAGAGIKSRMLLSSLEIPRLYVPIDIAGEYLNATVKHMQVDFPTLETWPVTADFTAEFAMPAGLPAGRRVALFLGSTIGNLDVLEAGALLGRMRKHVGPDGAAIIGVDLTKDLDTLLIAYDDRAGVTAEFNLNLLARINRELAGDFNLDMFAHEARWNEHESAIEMHLVSRIAQTVTVDGRRFHFEQAESVHTESSRKYDYEWFAALAEANGWNVRRTWSDDRVNFAILGLTPT